jgi:predicted transglutaminase-like cysteine proteinase
MRYYFDFGNKSKYIRLIYLSGMLMLSGCASTTSPFMVLGDAAPAPVGYLKFCVNSPAECRAATPNAAAPIGEIASSSATEAATPTISIDLPAPHLDAGPLAQRAMIIDVDRAPTLPGLMRANALTGGDAAMMMDAAWIRPAASKDAFASTALEPAAMMDAVWIRPAAPTDAFASTILEPQAPWASAGQAIQATPSRAPLRLDSVLLGKLNETNRQINASIQAKPDQETFGDSDYWHLPILEGNRTGDCKDFVLEKRRALINSGLPADALSIAIVRTRANEGHAVLLVSTDKGEYVLDNLTPWATPWRNLDYRWIERQSPGEPLSWVGIASNG